MDIKEVISKGEKIDIEFKSWKKIKDKKELMKIITKEAVALANTKGGMILIGVEDNGEITGCDNYDIQNIMESIYDRTIPKLFTDIEEVFVENNTILVIYVPKGSTLYATSAGEVYKRLGKNTKPMFPEEFPIMQSGKVNNDFSNVIIEDSSEEDIDSLEVYKIKEKLKIRDPESTLPLMDDKSFLKDLHLIKEKDNKIKLTVAGMLFVGKESSINRTIPQAEIIYLHYSDINKTEYDKRIDLKVPIISALDRLTEIIESSNYITNIQIGLFRLEVKDFPKNVFQEAILNAICHRDYQSNGAIYVKHYSNKIVIENPGGFPEGINENNIITHPSIPRNKLIAETLQKLKYVQRSGQGVDIIFRDMIFFGKPLPTYSTYSEAVTLTLKSNLEDKNFTKFLIEEQDKNQIIFSTSQIMILKYLKDNGTITLEDASKHAQLSLEDTQGVLNELINYGYVERNGFKKYILTEKVYYSLGDDVGYIKDKEIEYIRAKDMIIQYLKKNNSINNTKVRELCGCSERKAKYYLDKMMEEALLEPKGEKRYRVYLLKK
ncbi:ATP-dependent DNA helicase RecG [Alkalithermobacter thermoalcaliphilus JW-YL-7 = DSM 7308]|uniref:ATP-dependent DNA helicase RecG n=1 Tax=Alkalithermobacter thermoalcaliphilus JW-YL-7 = DSM 7308 TaxID=1121328 RepID=A0A150FUJ1_CLOPD|nr:putative transcriptional regulator [[Clostridium] paradoxum JW-YL-7 = DSM 7308]SHL33629.1 ATP-dependent DNA helicase RecG [[Clostridium] paradoxum JW-YL-7 = DSM 7308]